MELVVVFLEVVGRAGSVSDNQNLDLVFSILG